MTSSARVPAMRECSLQAFAAQLSDLMDGVSGLAVALSGGLDSSVLLSLAHALQQHADTPCQLKLYAIHVNHGLSPNAEDWEAFCREICNTLGVELIVERVTIDRSIGPSLENLARKQRYAAFRRHLQPDHGLLMAHHLDDHGETFLLRALRGAGPRGLGAMPARRPLGQGWLLRPLLGCPRSELERYARQQQLSWIEDESNQSSDFDRNYLRREVLPLIEARWPGYRDSWQRSAALTAEADQLLQELAALDLSTIEHTVQGVRGAAEPTLDCKALSRLGNARQRNLLRLWLRQSGIAEPGYHVLQQILNELMPAAVDAQPQVRWNTPSATIVLRRHRDMLHASVMAESSADEFELQPDRPLTLPHNGTVTLTLDTLPREVTRFTARYRRGGERLRLQGRRMRLLKKILQDSGLPPWQRDRLPLLFADDELVAIAGVGVAEGWHLQFSWCAPRL